MSHVATAHVFNINLDNIPDNAVPHTWYH